MGGEEVEEVEDGTGSAVVVVVVATADDKAGAVVAGVEEEEEAATETEGVDRAAITAVVDPGPLSPVLGAMETSALVGLLSASPPG
jgi:hypothetical protein